LKQRNDFNYDMIDLDDYPNTELWMAEKVESAVQGDSGSIELTVRFVRLDWEGGIRIYDPPQREREVLTLSRYTGGILRLTNSKKPLTDSPMMALADGVKQEALTLSGEKDNPLIQDGDRKEAARFNLSQQEIRFWSDQIPAPFSRLTGSFCPDGETPVTLASWDQFVPTKIESVPLGYVKRHEEGRAEREWLFSFTARSDEHFMGTGERFHSFDLRGRTVTLENTDALGVNNRRAYKNIPFYLSSEGYGLFIHNSAHIRLSFADISTRSVQGLIEDDELDLFLIGGGTPEKVLHRYRQLTGFPGTLPLWSYGTWMSRMTYFSDEEITGIFTRMREENYPCDVIHIDTGWFARDWVCEWTFSEERFPDPAEFMKRMNGMGYRISLWQTPNIGEGNRLLELAREKRYLAPVMEAPSSASDFSGQDYGGQIDFTNPEAVTWYKGMLKNLFSLGASAIKTDFGENIGYADYKGVPTRLLHNLYALLYQKAAYEATEDFHGQGIIWARSSWAGSQRYPLHWGGDAAATWEGMASSLIGGLQLGLSGFAYWSHDVPGFHGVPNFMNSVISDELYLRWTQFGVLSSHLRYHGTSAREPWEFPGVADQVREWLKFRYALIPYLMEESRASEDTGYPLLRALMLHYPQDPACWNIADEYLLGKDLLVAPVMNGESVRSVYLPEGEWIDFWTGEQLTGERWLKKLKVPLSRIPLYVRAGAELPFYPEAVACTDDMTKDPGKILFDGEYRGYKKTFLGAYIDL